VSECDREAWTIRRSRLTRAVELWGRRNVIKHVALIVFLLLDVTESA